MRLRDKRRLAITTGPYGHIQLSSKGVDKIRRWDCKTATGLAILPDADGGSDLSPHTSRQPQSMLASDRTTRENNGCFSGWRSVAGGLDVGNEETDKHCRKLYGRRDSLLVFSSLFFTKTAVSAAQTSLRQLLQNKSPTRQGLWKNGVLEQGLSPICCASPATASRRLSRTTGAAHKRKRLVYRVGAFTTKIAGRSTIFHRHLMAVIRVAKCISSVVDRSVVPPRH